MIQNKALSLLGLATKAGKTVSGEFSTEKSVKASAAVQDENFANALIKKLADSGVFPEEA